MDNFQERAVDRSRQVNFRDIIDVCLYVGAFDVDSPLDYDNAFISLVVAAGRERDRKRKREREREREGKGEHNGD